MELFTNGQPWVQQYGINSSKSGALGSLGNYTSNIPNTPVAGLGLTLTDAFVAHGFVFFIGGVISGSASSRVYRAPVTSSTTVGAWVRLDDVTSGLPDAARYGHKIILVGSKIYLVGGYNTSSVLSATIGTDGSISGWAQEAYSVPAGIFLGSVFVKNNRITVAGGYANGWTPSAAVYSAPIDSTTGAIGQWSANSQSLPFTVSEAALSVIGDDVYLIGGYHGGTLTGAAVKATVGEDGLAGSWATVSGLTIPTPTRRAAAVTVNSSIYYIGGQDSGGTPATANYVSVISSGTPGAWSATDSSSVGLSGNSLAVANSLLVSIGGYTTYAAADGRCYCRTFLGGYSDYSDYDSENISPVGDLSCVELSDSCDSVATNGAVSVVSDELQDDASMLATVPSVGVVASVENKDECFSLGTSTFYTGDGSVYADEEIDVCRSYALNEIVSITSNEIVDDAYVAATVPSVGVVSSNEQTDSVVSVGYILGSGVISSEEYPDSSFSTADIGSKTSIICAELTDSCFSSSSTQKSIYSSINAEEVQDTAVSYSYSVGSGAVVCDEMTDASLSTCLSPVGAYISCGLNQDACVIRIASSFFTLKFERDAANIGSIDGAQFDALAFHR